MAIQFGETDEQKLFREKVRLEYTHLCREERVDPEPTITHRTNYSARQQQLWTEARFNVQKRERNT